MPLPRPDEQPLPSRRALREAERARAAAAAGASAGDPVGVPVVGERAAAAVHPVPRTRRAARAARNPAPEQRAAEPVAPPVVERVVEPVAPPVVERVVEPAPPLPRRRRRPRADVPVAPVPVAGPVVVPPVALPVVEVLGDHVLEGGDDVWVDDVAPRPTPVHSRTPAEPEPVRPVVAPRPSVWRRLPQVAVVGSLVAATAGYALVGDISATAGSVPTFVREEADVTAQQDAIVAELDAGSTLVAGEDGLLRVAAPEEASRGGERTVLPGCDGVPPETPQANGRMDRDFLCTLWDGKTEIRADAAVSLALLNEEYRAEFGRDLCMTDGYRSYAAQASLRARKPGLAARPGTSEHGYGLAVDFCGGIESAGPAYRWMADNAPEHGWENPRWAQRGGGGPYEPWHWEYVAGQW